MKKSLSILLSLLMVFSAFSVMPFSAFAATEYDLWVGGTRVTSENLNDIPAAAGYEEYAGKAFFSKDSNTLYLDKYCYKGDGYNGAAIYWDSQETLRIVVLKQNRLCSTANDNEHCVYGIKAVYGALEIESGSDAGSGYVGGVVDIANKTDPDDTEKDYGIYAKGGVTVFNAAVYSSATQGNNNYGIKAASVTADDKSYITATAGEAAGESIGISLTENLMLSDGCRFFEVSGTDCAIQGAASSTAVISADGIGWANMNGSGNGINFSPAEYTMADLSACKKLMLPVVMSGQLGDNVYYSIINETAYIYGSGEIWDYDKDTNPSPFYDPYFKSDSGSQPVPVDPEDEEEQYTLELISEEEAENEKKLVNSIVITDGITGIGNYAFNAHPYEHITIPGTVTSIGDNAFSDTNLYEALIPNSVTSFGKEAFSGSNNISVVSVPGSVKTIPEGAFKSDNNLKTVVIGKGVEKIEADAFHDCDSITDVYFPGTRAEWEAITVKSGNDSLLNANLHCNEPHCGTLGRGMILTSDTVSCEQATTVTIMMSGNRTGEKVLLFPDSSDTEASHLSRYVPFTEYNPYLDCSIAVAKVMFYTPGEHDTEAEYVDKDGIKYTVEDKIVVDKYNTLLEKPEDQSVLTGEDVYYRFYVDDNATGEIRVFLTKGGKTVKYIPKRIKDGTTSITISGLEAGEYAVTVNYYGDDSYKAVSTNAKLTVREPLTASIENTEIEYGDALPDGLKARYLTAGGQALTKAKIEEYGLPETLPFTCDYKQFDNAGTYTLSINEEEVPQSYRLAYADSALTVKKAPLTITANKQEYTYNGLYQGPEDTAYEDAQEIAELITAEGLKGTDAVTSVIIDGQGKDMGEYALVPQSASVNGKTEALGNYSITYVNGVLKINPKPLNITVFGQETYARYNGKEQSYTGTVLCTADPEFDFSKFSYTGNTTVKGTNAGDYEITPSAANCVYSDSNYKINWSVDSPIRLTITQCALDITADNKETNHGSDLAALTYTIDNLHSCYYNEDELNISISTNADKNKPGNYDIILSCEDNPNYAVRTFNGTYTVGDSPHTWSDVTYEWTGTSSVTASRKCVYCDETDTETVNTTAEQTKAPTCTENGDTTYTATFTKTAFETQIRTLDDVDALGHDYGEPTYEWMHENGVWKCTAKRVCTRDASHIETETVEGAGAEKEPATCTENGTTTYTATFTNAAFTQQTKGVEDIPALTHVYTSTVTHPTCTEQGYTTYTCKRCEHEYKADYVEALSHDYTSAVTAPTCTEKGYTTNTCTRCGDAYVSDYTDALGHKYGEEGKERYTCTVCGAVDEALKKAYTEKDKAEFAASVTITPEDDGATIAWKKAPEAKRYVIYAAYCGKNKYKKIKTVKDNITSFKLTKLSGKKINTRKNLKVYIVVQKKANGKWVKLFKTPTFHTAGKNSKYTNIKKIKVKKAEFTLEQGNTAKIKAKLVLVNKKKKPINHVRKLRYMSTNTAVVKVTKSGKIKAVGKGKATIYVFSNNGTPKAIKVTVK